MSRKSYLQTEAAANGEMLEGAPGGLAPGMGGGRLGTTGVATGD